MTSGTATPEAGKSDDRPDDQFDVLIDQRLRQTRRQMAGVDIVGGLVVSAVGVLVYLLLVAVLDHWLVPGGLGFWGRLFCLVGLLGGLGFYLRLRVLPPLIRRINPVFAAHTIEQSRPTLKNSLINFLLLRSHRREVHKAVYKALQQRAADDVNGVPIELAVDRTPVIRLGYLLAGVLAACCLYFVISPKSPLVSAARIIWPWADIQAPTRVTIEEIKPGDTVGFNGEQITVSAEVDGLGADEPVTLYYSTADGQSVDQAIPLSLPERGYRYGCVLPPGSLGLQQNMEYRLVAGDCRTRTFTITVQIPPAIVVDNITYEYPAYTEIPARTVEGQGDIRAIEGTRITINAEANLPIGRAEIDLNCNGRQRLKMKADGKSAVGLFTLRAEHESYQLTFSDEAGRANRRPIRHAVEVIADMPPRIELVDPPDEQIQLPVNGTLELQVRAEDPDFALRRVSIRAERDGRSLPIRPLLDKPRPEQPLYHARPGIANSPLPGNKTKTQSSTVQRIRGDFQAAYRFQPEQLGLVAGDRIVYFAEAQDNKSPVPNRTETRRRWITIVPPQTQDQPKDKQQEQQDKQQDKSKDKQEGKGQPDDKQDQPEGKQDQQESKPDQPEGKQDQQEPKQDQQDQQEGKQDKQEGKQDEQESKRDKEQGSEPGQSGKEGASDQSGKEGKSSQSGETMPGEDGGGESGGQSREPIDGESNPGDAVEEILKHRQGQQNGRPSDKPSDQQPTDGQQQPADQPPGKQSSEPGASQQKDASEQKPSEQKPSDQKPGGEGQKSEPQPSAKPAKPEGEKGEGTEQGEKQAASDNAQGDSQGSEKSDKPGPGKGAQSKAEGEPGEKEPTPGQSMPKPKPDATGGDPNDSKGDPGAGKPSKDDQTGSPSPQEANQQRDKKPGDQPDQAGEKKDEKADSPSNSPKDSDSQGDTAGDRSGGGKKGGGQRANQSGTGSAGNNTAADQGGSQSDQKGEGPTGEKAGDQIESDRPTGKSAPKGEGAGSKGGGKPGSKTPQPNPQDQPGQDGQNENGRPGQSDKPSQKPPEGESRGKPQGHGPGNPTAGGGPGKHSDLKPTPDAELAPGEDPNLDYARKQTVLALEHLKDQLAKEQPDQELLDRLGWTREDMTRFAERWEKMRRQAAGQGSDAGSAKKEFDEAVRSLGIRRGLTELKGGGLEADKPGRIKDSRRVAPPADWAEQFRAYSHGVAGGKP